MNELLKYYTTRLTGLALVVAMGIVFVDKVVDPYVLSQFGPNHWITTIQQSLTSRLAIVGVLALGEYLIRKYIWKLERPELDFSGDWSGITTFEYIPVGTGRVPFTTEYEVKIEQDCLGMKILPSTGASFVNWGSLALELADKDTLRYAYWVRYSDRARFPEEAVGYEEVKVTRRDRKKRPIEMTGSFYHCAKGQTPVYNGAVKFSRSRFVQKPSAKSKGKR